MKTINIGVVGSRRRNDEASRLLVFTEIDKLILKLMNDPSYDPKETRIQLVSGGCKKFNRDTKTWDGCGADWFAEEYAAIYGFSMIIHYPRHYTKDKSRRGDWEATRVNYERNQYIIDDAHHLIALVTDDRKGGTEDSVKRFTRKYKNELWRLNLK